MTGCLSGWDCTLNDEMPEFDNLESINGTTLEAILTGGYEEDIFGEDFTTGKYIINDDTTYNAWKEIAEEKCGSLCSFPDIDFSTRTLIGKYYRLTCTELPAVKVTKEGDTYTHTVKRIDNTQCVTASCSNFTFGFVTIPKMDSTENVIFKSGASRYICTNC